MTSTSGTAAPEAGMPAPEPGAVLETGMPAPEPGAALETGMPAPEPGMPGAAALEAR